VHRENALWIERQQYGKSNVFGEMPQEVFLKGMPGEANAGN